MYDSTCVCVHVYACECTLVCFCKGVSVSMHVAVCDTVSLYVCEAMKGEWHGELYGSVSRGKEFKELLSCFSGS